MKLIRLLLLVLVFLIPTSCANQKTVTSTTLAGEPVIGATAMTAQPTATLTPLEQTLAPTPQFTLTALPEWIETATLASTPTEEIKEVILPYGTPPPPPREWSGWSVLPYVSENAIQIYREGIASGNLPDVFSVIGDCQSVPDVFLGIYATDRYALPEKYAYLSDTIAYFSGSFNNIRPAVRNGISVTSVLSPLWADPELCMPDEIPIACDHRLNKPSIVFINLGTNWTFGGSAGKYEEYLRLVVDAVIANGSLPILSTKADNIEGDYSINIATVRVAYDYDIPLWNFWSAADMLPGHGLEADGIYLTPDAWDLRNFTALQTLDTVWKAVRS